jgi:formylglycine-generating enzyme required for sulfatase activity
VTVRFSDDDGSTYAIEPLPGTLSGDVGYVDTPGAGKRILWDAARSLPSNTYGTTFKAAVTAQGGLMGQEEITVDLPGGVSIVLVHIPAGSFQMGRYAGERGSSEVEDPQHAVVLTSDFYIGKYEITQEQWMTVMGVNPATGVDSGWGYPVYSVSWNDIAGPGGFIDKLNQLLGSANYRHPTEAEWEFAARGSTDGGPPTRFSFGDVLECGDECDPCPTQEQYMLWCGNDQALCEPVGRRLPNGFGLCDMHGNLWEWAQDWYGTYGSGQQTDPTGPVSGTDRVGRGGSWGALAKECRSASRLHGYPQGRSHTGGFRVARSL